MVGLDGHSDYGAAFRQFAERHLADTVGAGTTVIVTGDARGNYRDRAPPPSPRSPGEPAASTG